MKSYFLLSSFLLIAGIIWSQAQRNLNLGFYVEPHSSGPQDFITEVRDGPNGGRLDEKAKLSFTAGLIGEWNVDSRSAVPLGLLFDDRGYQTVWTPNDRLEAQVHTRFRFSYFRRLSFIDPETDSPISSHQRLFVSRTHQINLL